MARGVGVLGAERRAERVDVLERQREDLGFQLAGNGQVRGFAEEVLGVVHRAVLVLGHVLQIQGRDVEHLAGAFGVAGSDQRRVRVDVALILEELVDGVRADAADAEHGGEQVRSRAQVGLRAQELQAVALVLDGIVRIGGRGHGHLGRLDLERLLGLRGQHEGALDDQRRRQRQFRHFFEIAEELLFVYDLNRLEIGSVVQLDKSECVGVAVVSDPAAHFNRFIGIGSRILENKSEFCHLSCLSSNNDKIQVPISHHT